MRSDPSDSTGRGPGDPWWASSGADVPPEETTAPSDVLRDLLTGLGLSIPNETKDQLGVAAGQLVAAGMSLAGAARSWWAAQPWSEPTEPAEPVATDSPAEASWT